MIEYLNINKIQYVAIAGSIFFLLFIFELIRNKKIKESYSLLWLFFGIVFVVFSIWRNGLEIISKLLGIAYPPAALFLILLITILFILIQFSIIVTKFSKNINDLTQELGLLKMEVKKKEEMSKSQSPE